VVEEPLQIAVAAGLMVTTGKVFTVTVTDAVALQPAFEIPVTIYIVEASGLTVMFEPVTPVFQSNVFAPLAVKVTDAPAHISVLDAVHSTIGSALTTTLSEADAEHPCMSVPVTV
jgi:hypothetical protein